MDCEDGSDEEQCGTTAPDVKKSTTVPTPKHVCEPHNFQCNSGLFILLIMH